MSDKYDVSGVLFSTPFWHYRKPPQEGAVKWALEYEKANPESAVISNLGGYQSISKKDFTLIPFLDILKDSLKPLPPFVFLNWWLNVNRKDDYNITHTHPNSDLSAVYSITDNNGTLILINPLQHLHGQIERCCEWEDHQVLSNTSRITTISGDLIVFPSHIPHRVNPNLSDNPRISLAFNLKFLD